MKGVYKITAKHNKKYYVGSSKDCENRWQRHLLDLKKQRHHNFYLQNVYNKHGEANLAFEIVLESEDYLLEEQKILNSLDYSKVFNLSKSASGGDLISYHPNKKEFVSRMVETIRKKRIAGEINSTPKFGKDNPNWRGGKTFCKCGARIGSYTKTCSKCRNRSGGNNPFYGKKHSNESLKKMSKNSLGKYNGNQEKVVIIEGVEYKSVSEAGRQLGKNPSVIVYRIKSKNNKFSNYFYKINA
jgi:group I intron endonuclease